MPTPAAPANGAIPPATLAAARRRIARANRVLLLTHVSPDGDAVGSLLGLGLALRAAGKEVSFACADPIPDTFRFLPACGEITDNPPGQFDLIVALDTADVGRLGKLGENLSRPIDLALDHHTTNPGYADLNLIDEAAASTAELVAELLEPLGLPLTRSVAECLLAGIITDTLGFRTSNVTAKTLALTHKLVTAGASLPEVYDLSFYKRSFAAMRLWGYGLSRMKLEDRIVWTTLTLHDKEQAHYHGQGDADLVNTLTSVREADIALILTERDDGRVKVSWRAVPGLNVATLAATFGGGGHMAAAGAEIPGPLDEAEKRVLEATRALLKANGSGGAV
ncbi:MAG: DHH family phosphoesterase [Anaerolineales bacterium]|nr:DHH family phosphoesterase [Anaerolineales bacterium]